MEISEILLSPQQKEFLKSENPLHFNKSAYRNVISLKLNKFVKTIEVILDDTHNLSEEHIYEILNARTLSKILTNLLLDVEKPSEERRNRYDFRTIETARLLFEVSANYLKHSPYFEDNESIQNDIKRVTDHYTTLADFGLDKETSGILVKYTSKKSDKAKNKRLDYEKEIEGDLTKQGLSNVTALYEAYTKNGNEAYNTLQEIKKLTNMRKAMKEKINATKNKKEKKDNEKKYYAILLKLDELKKKHKSLIKPLHDKHTEIINTLDKKYSDVYDYSCPINPLVGLSGLEEMKKFVNSKIYD